MQCVEFENLLNDLIDLRQPLTLTDDARKHLSHCSECQEVWQGYQSIAKAQAIYVSRVEAAIPVAEPSSSATPNLDPTTVRSRPPAGPVRQVPLAAEGRSGGRRRGVPLAESTAPAPVAAPLFHSETAPVSATPKWSLVPIVASLIPVSAAMYLLGLGLWNLPSQRDHITGAVIHQAPEATGFDDGKFYDPAIDHGIQQFEAGWKGLAVPRFTASRLPGTEPLIGPFMGAVEAAREGLRNRPKPEPKNPSR